MEYLLDFYETVDKSDLEQTKMKMKSQIRLNEGLCELQDLRVFLTRLQESASVMKRTFWKHRNYNYFSNCPWFVNI